MREPSKEQLLAAGVLPNWNKEKDPSATEVLLEGQRRTWHSDKVPTKKPKPHGVGGPASRQQPSRQDSSKAVSVFGDRTQSKQGGRRHVAYTAVLDKKAPMDGASYQSTATGASASQSSAAVDKESEDSSSSDDSGLPFHLCPGCKDTQVLGGGGILECSTC